MLILPEQFFNMLHFCCIDPSLRATWEVTQGPILHKFLMCRFSFSVHNFFTFNCNTGGKRDEELILPVNSSLSATLHQDQVSYLIIFLSRIKKNCNVAKVYSSNSFILQLCAKTTVAASKSFTQDRMWLNGV